MTRRLLRWLGAVLCGVRGHDAVLTFEGNRMLMRCTSCGHDTPGWETTTGRGPRRRFDGDPKRHAMTPLRLVKGKRA